jgi:acyl-CoA synthetase (AMP-forming)/AMP-acid ligase II
MTGAPDPALLAAAAAQARGTLTGPGGEFEIAARLDDSAGVPAFVTLPPSLRALLAASAELGDREYLVDDRHRLSYADHVHAVASFAHRLDTIGVRPGDRVLVLGANSVEWVVAFWAAATLGAITVAGNARWTQREVEHAIERTEPAVVVADERRRKLFASTPVPVIDMTDVVATTTDAELPDVDVDLDAPAVIMFTSGTTGFPKGAVHSHRNLLSVIQYHRLNDALAAAMGAAPQLPRRFLMSLPLFHIASLHNLVLPRLATGDTVVIDRGRFDVPTVLGLIEREHVTNWAIVPTMAHRIAEFDGVDRFDLSSLTALSVNSAPSSDALKQRLRAALPQISATLADSYGLTESTTAATVASALDLAMRPGTVGRPVAGVDLQIRDAGGNAVPEGVEGEICIRSAYAMTGYWRDDAATDAMFPGDGWMRTGDIGSLRDGYLFMSTRRTDLILRGGENVYPAEIEAVLDEHPAVVESAVFGIDHPDLGQEVAAVVVADGSTADELRAYAAERLAYYKVPTRWRLQREPLQRTATGKIVRAGLSL